tara:strand:- start:143 stop:493 length:351 start_codon:yes stop_codon:yes gene_type:complete
MDKQKKTAVRRVFVLTDDERFNTQNAEEYGARIFLEPKATPFTPIEFMEEVVEYLDKYLYDSEKDYILFAGPVQALALYIGTVMAEYAPVNILLYHAPSEKYQAKTICENYTREKV